MDAIFMPPTYETESWVSEDNFLVILQTNQLGEASQIHLSKEQAQTIFNHLLGMRFII